MPKKVILYSANGDPQNIRKMLDEQGIDYEYVDVSDDPETNEAKPQSNDAPSGTSTSTDE